MEFLGGVLGVGAGFGLASFVDRMIITHALTNGQDAPAQGTIYNSEVLLTPLWYGPNAWKRMLGAAGAVFAPLFAARFVNKHQGMKVFFQLMGFGALGRTAGKAMDDAVASLMSSNTTVQQLYSGELAATAKMNAANLNALPPAPPATFAGTPASQARATRFVGAGPTRALGAFSQLPGTMGMLGSSAAPDPEMQAAATVAVPVPNPAPSPPPQAPVTSPPVPASTSLFIPALCNPDGMQ
jgi:hypothetical protein